jgi:glycerate 2-kinase
VNADAAAVARVHAAQILRAAIAAADPAPLVTRGILAAPALNAHQTVHVLAVGKAAARMCAAALDALDQLGARVAAALLILPHNATAPAPRDNVRVLHAAHPLPDASSTAAGLAAERLLTATAADDIVLVLLSGGASALAVLPVNGLSVEDYASRVDSIMRAGGDIHELNTERRRIDRLKAGGMAALAAPSRVIGLVLSDVVGDPLDMIASGPLTPDGAPAANATVSVVGNNDVALDGAAHCATTLGYEVRRIGHALTGEARTAGVWLAREAMRLQVELIDDMAVCLLAGGETTVTVTGDGVGGRNQELVLAAALELASVPGITIAAAGTDGVDGPTGAAGAIADPDTLLRAAAAGIDAARSLQHNDSYTFFNAVGGGFVTGPTGTNVLDIQLALIRPSGDRSLTP